MVQNLILASVPNLRHDLGMNGKLIIIIAFTALIGIITTGYFYTQNVIEKRDRYKTERNEARANLQTCEDSKAITEEVSNEFQNKLAAANRRNSDLMRVRTNPKCIPIIPSPAR